MHETRMSTIAILGSWNANKHSYKLGGGSEGRWRIPASLPPPPPNKNNLKLPPQKYNIVLPLIQ